MRLIRLLKISSLTDAEQKTGAQGARATETSLKSAGIGNSSDKTTFLDQLNSRGHQPIVRVDRRRELERRPYRHHQEAGKAIKAIRVTMGVTPDDVGISDLPHSRSR